jgi:hypothetical protein
MQGIANAAHSKTLEQVEDEQVMQIMKNRGFTVIS